MVLKLCLSDHYSTIENMDRKMENLSNSPTTKPPDETTKTIIVYGYPEAEDPKVPPPPDLTNTEPGGPIVVRTEEVLIVVFVLILWAAAIALFFNRWGKIRMLEPYQPKFHEEEHRPSCPLNELATPAIGVGPHRTSMSKYNVTAGCLEPLAPLYPTPPSTHRTANLLRSRQNSVFTGHSNVQLSNGMCCPRKTRSAMDINSLGLHENPAATASRPNSSMLPMSMADRRLSYAQHSGATMCAVTAALKDKRSCSLFPHGAHDRRRSCMGDCSIISLRDRYGYRDALSPHLPHSCRRTSCAVGGDYLGYGCTATAIVAKERKPSFNNVLAQVTAERRPSSSMLRISNV